MLDVCFLADNPVKNSPHGIERYEFELIRNIRQFCRPIVASKGDQSTFFKRYVKDLVYPFSIYPIKADIYHAVNQFSSTAAVLTGKSPLVTTVHDFIPFENSVTRFYSEKVDLMSKLGLKYMKILTKFAKKSDMIIAPFEITREDIINILGVEEERIRNVPFGVDMESFNPTDFKKENDENFNVILFIGGLNKAKGAGDLLNAMAKVKEEYSDVQLWIGGKWNLFNGKKMVKKLGLERHVKFLGHIPEKKLPYYYNLADIIALPYWIGFTLCILEGMAMRKPVVASNTPDVKEYVGDSCLLVPPRDPAELCGALLKLLKDEKLRKRLSKSAYERAKKYTWTNTAIKTMEVYNEIAFGNGFQDNVNMVDG